MGGCLRRKLRSELVSGLSKADCPPKSERALSIEVLNRIKRLKRRGLHLSDSWSCSSGHEPWGWGGQRGPGYLAQVPGLTCTVGVGTSQGWEVQWGPGPWTDLCDGCWVYEP